LALVCHSPQVSGPPSGNELALGKAGGDQSDGGLFVTGQLTRGGRGMVMMMRIMRWWR
jgi:hypothetical protein